MTGQTVVAPLDYLHVNVFAARAYAGNSLPVFLDAGNLDARQMLAITQELRHFEATFLAPAGAERRYHARVFDLFEELPFAGHPIIGAAAALHELCGEDGDCSWTFDLAEKSVTVDTRRTVAGYFGLLDAGPVQVLGEIEERDRFAAAFGLTGGDLDVQLPLEVLDGGLRYAVVPVRSESLARASIREDISGMLHGVGAQFAVLLDEAKLEVRHWNNDGLIEDVATGSAAAVIGAYRLRHCAVPSGATFTLHQGRFARRPSELVVEPHGTPAQIHSVRVGGGVAIVGRGRLEARP